MRYRKAYTTKASEGEEGKEGQKYPRGCGKPLPAAEGGEDGEVVPEDDGSPRQQLPFQRQPRQHHQPHRQRALEDIRQRHQHPGSKAELVLEVARPHVAVAQGTDIRLVHHARVHQRGGERPDAHKR